MALLSLYWVVGVFDAIAAQGECKMHLERTYVSRTLKIAGEGRRPRHMTETPLRIPRQAFVDETIDAVGALVSAAGLA